MEGRSTSAPQTPSIANTHSWHPSSRFSLVPDTFNPPAGNPTTSEILKNILDTLEKHLHESAGPKHEYQYLPWLRDFKHALESHFEVENGTRKSARAIFPPNWSPASRNKHGLNIAASDKGKHILFACTSLFQSLTTDFMTNSGRFEPTALTAEQIYEHHTRSLRDVLHNDTAEADNPNTFVSQDPHTQYKPERSQTTATATPQNHPTTTSHET
jgi:hypothetical protein